MESKVDLLRTFLDQVAPGDDGESLLEGNTPDFTSRAAAADPRAATALEHLAHGQELSGEDQFALEAIILPDGNPPSTSSTATSPSPTRHGSTSTPTRGYIRRSGGLCDPSAASICPVTPHSLRRHRIVVDDRLIMTNRHVAELSPSGLGIATQVLPGVGVDVDFMHGLGSDASCCSTSMPWR